MAISIEELERRKLAMKENGRLMDERWRRLEDERVEHLMTRIQSSIPGDKSSIDQLDEIFGAYPESGRSEACRDIDK
ncbi:hypothetical protein [Neorhizobium galegae]|uniref:hypothetical protein n=1 Tax=Neorhizobium galegae TaxID=399 RepID=UPI001281520F|nr:hypothetical protein [Neorhizobium galegae]KAA9387943.1 hypothetical protein F4V88_16505 [Neorhizobium galegae]MCM2500655.1 hypothetical protein [Neorhizobium galegae]MCQ1774089.1 hypothetical protein [Neorhizobium galegae]MCQ1800159.1 hypothetical protein [Neorhizobium galegae]